jgi:hypothetical protein
MAGIKIQEKTKIDLTTCLVFSTSGGGKSCHPETNFGGHLFG